MDASNTATHPCSGPQIAMFVRNTFFGHLIVMLFLFGLQLIYQNYGSQINTDGHWIMRVLFGVLLVVIMYHIYKTSSYPTRMLLFAYLFAVMAMFVTSLVAASKRTRYLPTLPMVMGILFYTMFFFPARHINSAQPCIPSSRSRTVQMVDRAYQNAT